jgi:hypothetical protein
MTTPFTIMNLRKPTFDDVFYRYDENYTLFSNHCFCFLIVDMRLGAIIGVAGFIDLLCDGCSRLLRVVTPLPAMDLLTERLIFIFSFPRRSSIRCFILFYCYWF